MERQCGPLRSKAMGERKEQLAKEAEEKRRLEEEAQRARDAMKNQGQRPSTSSEGGEDDLNPDFADFLRSLEEKKGAKKSPHENSTG